MPHRCTAHFDAVAQIRGEAFFFKGTPVGRGTRGGGGPRARPAATRTVPTGKYFWRLTRDRHLVSLQPAQVQRFWRGLPLHLDGVDAVYERAIDHKIVFFKGGDPARPPPGPPRLPLHRGEPWVCSEHSRGQPVPRGATRARLLSAYCVPRTARPCRPRGPEHGTPALTLGVHTVSSHRG